jgi:iron complex outermembrane receptor protein
MAATGIPACWRKLKGTQLFGRVDYDMAQDTHAYAQVSGNLKTNTNFAETDQLNNVTLRRTNAFLPAQYQALMPATQPTFTYSQFLSEIPRLQADSDTKQWVFVTGLEGKAGGLKWNVDYTYGRARLDTAMPTSSTARTWRPRWMPSSSGGQTVCNITVTNPGLADNCVPLNAFGPSAASAEAIDYVTDTINFNSTTVMNDVTAAVTGSPFDSWAGPVNAALSGEWRDLSFSSHSSARPTDLVNCTGLSLNCTPPAP